VFGSNSVVLLGSRGFCPMIAAQHSRVDILTILPPANPPASSSDRICRD
jgi:hypothetical protein